MARMGLGCKRYTSDIDIAIQSESTREVLVMDVTPSPKRGMQ